MSTLKFAFAGFRHPHINTLLQLVEEHPDCVIVGMAEEDASTRKSLEEAGKIKLTHASIEAMINETKPDVLAIGDVYGRRGRIAIDALEKGLHVIADKPVCTRLEELDRIAELTRKNQRALGCMLDLRESAPFVTLHQIIREGLIGDVVTLNVTGQHPLLYGKRAAWYFEPDAHGGTINDIGIHAFDLAVWLTGSPWARILGARSWNAKATQATHFLDSAQMLGQLESGAGVLADFSYLAPDGLGYTLPQYWRVTVHGSKGLAETYYQAKSVTLVTDQDKAVREIPLQAPNPGAHLRDFLADLQGKPNPDGLNTRNILESSRQALLAQAVSEKA